MKPLVSILIPAYRPDWLDLALASALAQTYENIEILIGDDCPTNAVEKIVSKWRDGRISYYRNARRDAPGANRDFLLSLAKGDYIKFLFDDDFLFPQSVSILIKACQEYNAHLAFHGRHRVDGLGRILNSPVNLPGQGFRVIPPSFFFEQIVNLLFNRIGEPSNILIDRRALNTMKRPFFIAGRRMRFLTDMALYTNFMLAGFTVVGTPEFGSAFRKHEQQYSNNSHPGFSAGVFEWELLRRWSAQHKQLSAGLFNEANSRQHGLYLQHVKAFPELQGFMDLMPVSAGESFMSRQFLEALRAADLTIALRVATRK